MKVITVKSYFLYYVLPPILCLVIPIFVFIVGALIVNISTEPNSFLRIIQGIILIIIFFISIPLILFLLYAILAIFILLFKVAIIKVALKNYNKVCISQWRQDLIALNFIEIFEGKGMEVCILKGVYETLPIQIKSSIYKYDFIEIYIPLNLEIGNDFTTYQEGFKKQYSAQNIQISQDKIVKTIKIADAVEDKIIWAAIHELRNIVNEDEYKEQKLLNYLRFDEI